MLKKLAIRYTKNTNSTNNSPLKSLLFLAKPPEKWQSRKTENFQIITTLLQPNTTENPAVPSTNSWAKSSGKPRCPLSLAITKVLFPPSFLLGWYQRRQSTKPRLPSPPCDNEAHLPAVSVENNTLGAATRQPSSVKKSGIISGLVQSPNSPPHPAEWGNLSPLGYHLRPEGTNKLNKQTNKNKWNKFKKGKSPK